MWIFPWIKPFWKSCSFSDKLGWLIWFWQFLCEGLSSFNPKEFCCYSYAWSCSLCEWRTSFCMELISRKLQILTYVFDWCYFTHSYFFFLYWSPSLSLYTVFDAILSNIDEVSWLTHQLMCLSLQTLALIIKTGEPILVELIDMVNSAVILISNDLTGYKGHNEPWFIKVILALFLWWF